MKTNEQIAIEQRDYWLSVVRENRDWTFGQQAEDEAGLPEDPFEFAPAAWAEYWNLQISGENRR